MQTRNRDLKCIPEIQNEVQRVAGGDMSMSETRWFDWLRWGMLLGVTAWSAFGAAQEPANRKQPPSPESLHESVSDSVRELREQVRELQAAVAGMRSDWQRTRAETAELRRELEEVRAGTVPRSAVLKDAVAKSETPTSTSTSMTSSDAVASISQNVLASPEDQKPDDQKEHQNKGEHAASAEEEYQLLSGKVDE